MRLRISADLLHHFCSFKNGKYIQYSPVFETLNWHKISRCASLPNYAVLPQKRSVQNPKEQSIEVPEKIGVWRRSALPSPLGKVAARRADGRGFQGAFTEKRKKHSECSEPLPTPLRSAPLPRREGKSPANTNCSVRFRKPTVPIRPYPRFRKARYPSRISDAATASTVSLRFLPW